jgi:Ras-related GTP-binding protein C/D
MKRPDLEPLDVDSVAGQFSGTTIGGTGGDDGISPGAAVFGSYDSQGVGPPPHEMEDTGVPLIVLMGLPMAGKTSIQQVVFDKMSPHETLESNSSFAIQYRQVRYSDFVHFEICDVPGHIDLEADDGVAAEVFGRCSILAFVIDAQDVPYTDAMSKLVQAVEIAHRVRQDIRVKVFIHKIDGLSNEQSGATQRDIQGEVMDELNFPTSFHLTSIYDHSIFEAFSIVVQELNSHGPGDTTGMLQSQLDLLIGSCRIEKAFLFDVASKFYIASDSSPVDMQSLELCSEMVEVVVDISDIYGRDGANEQQDQYDVFDDKSFAAIKISNGMVLCLREVGPLLALVVRLCLQFVRTSFVAHQSMDLVSEPEAV